MNFMAVMVSNDIKIGKNDEVFSWTETSFWMFDQSIESNQEVEKVFEDYGIHFRRFEGVVEQGKEKFSGIVLI